MNKLVRFGLVALLATVALLTGGGEATALQSVTIEQNGPQPSNRIVRINYDVNTQVVVDLEANVRSILAGNERNNPDIVRQRVQDYLQMLVDDNVPGGPLSGRSLITDWPADDPARITDPAEGNFFHARQVGTIGTGPSAIPLFRPVALSGVGGTATHIIARPFLVSVQLSPTGEYDLIIQTSGFGLR